jgi:hypothetical protein
VKRNEAGPTRADFDGQSRELTVRRKTSGGGGDFWWLQRCSGGRGGQEAEGKRGGAHDVRRRKMVRREGSGGDGGRPSLYRRGGGVGWVVRSGHVAAGNGGPVAGICWVQWRRVVIGQAGDWCVSRALTTGPGALTSGRRIWFGFKFQKNSNQFQIPSNFDRPKKDSPELEKFEIKYGYEGFEERNKLLHRNFSRFEMDLKWKFREFSRFRIQ